jgi:hypothetical protein
MDKPRVGTRGTYRSPAHGEVGFTVCAVEGNLCWARYDNDEQAQPFIWSFKDGYNKLHDWNQSDALRAQAHEVKTGGVGD